VDGGQCEAKYDVVSGYDGPTLITIEVTDLANNDSRTTINDSLTVDTIKPVFSNIQSEISSNPEFMKFAKEGSEVKISFDVSEGLKFNPDVRVNEKTATFSRRFPNPTGESYEYIYTVSNHDREGNAIISISGFDFAMNEGTAETSSSAEAFVIDLTNPTVGISENPDLIANPSHFATNASSQEADLQTSVRYEISEDGYVTTRVYKVDNYKTTYTREDFTESKLIKVLERNVFKYAGVYYKDWNGSIEFNQAQFDVNNNGFADPGKYAFLVEVRDRAGNVTQRLWGGTVWIQDNVLKVQEPEQLNPDGTQMTNPHPKYFSPKNHPGDEAYGFATYRFKVLLGVTPKSYAEPERIEVLGIEDDIAWLEGTPKKGGYYTARVYDEWGNLVRIIETKEFATATNYYVKWDGKDDAGQYVPDGKYYIKVDVRDYLGGQAFDNYMTREVYVDNTSPEVIDNQAGDDTWKNNSRAGDTYDVDFRDSGTYPSKLAWAKYRIKKPDGSYSGWYSIPQVEGKTLFDTNWSIDFAQCGEGTNYIYVRAQDIAGNLTEPASYVFYVKKDTTRPIGNNPAIVINAGGNGYTNSRSVSLSLSATDPNGSRGSGVSHMKIWNDGQSEPPDFSAVSYSTFTSWTLRDLDGPRTVYVRFRDLAGNWSSDIYSASIILDRVAPSIENISDSPDPFSPNASPGVKDSITFSYSINEDATVKIYIDDSEQFSEFKSAGSHSWPWPPGSSVSEGSHSYYIWAEDRAGNSQTSSPYYFTVDNTPPAAPSGLSATSGNGVANLSWNSVSDADGYNIYRSNAYNGTYVKVKDMVSGTSYQDTGLTNGTRYWYKVTAADYAGNESGFSKYVLATPGILNNTKIAFVSTRDGNVEIYKMNTDGNNQVRLTNNSAWDGCPVWSPNGEKIAFVSSRDGNYEIYLMDADGSNLKRLTNNTADDFSPSFSPDGNKIVFCTNRDGNYEIYVMDTNGNHPIRLTNNVAADINPKYSPDGNNIIFSSNRDLNWGYELYLMKADGSSLSKLTNSTGSSSDNYASFSPDGTKVIFSSDREKSTWNYDIYIVNSDGTNLTRLTNSPTSNYYASFSPDGTKIVFASKRDGSEEVYLMDLSSNNQVRITTLGLNSAPSWSPFAPGMGGSSVSEQVATQSTTLEAPTLISPKTGDPPVKTRRPTFEWKAPKGMYEKYLPVWAKDKADLSNPAKRGEGRTMREAIDSTSKPNDPYSYFAYTIPYVDPALEANVLYYWTVLASTGETTVSPEAETFRCEPDFEISGVTNYPNPFNPNKEETNIRYKLSRDADEVKIRIYDITGALVVELDGDTQGEGTSMMTKYNDRKWNGRNGRGDVVMNGIYPFEVVARSGDKVVSGRGKIAVLK